MELLFVVLGGILLGLLGRYMLPERHSYGAALLPAVGGIVAAVAWVALTWLGWAYDGGWIWVVSLGLAAVASVAVAVALPPRRRTADEQLFERTRRA